MKHILSLTIRLKGEIIRKKRHRSGISNIENTDRQPSSGNT